MSTPTPTHHAAAPAREPAPAAKEQQPAADPSVPEVPASWKPLQKAFKSWVRRNGWLCMYEGKDVTDNLAGNLFPVVALAANAAWREATGADLPGFTIEFGDMALGFVLTESAPTPLWPWMLAIQEAMLAREPVPIPSMHRTPLPSRGFQIDITSIWNRHPDLVEAEATRRLSAPTPSAPRAKPQQ